MVKSIGELKKLIENIPDHYKLELSVDNGVDGKSADHGMSSHSPIRIDIWDDEKIVSFSGSTYTKY